MRVLLQRVKNAEVKVEGRSVGKTGEGLLLLVGICKGDGTEDVEYLSRKVLNLRIFGDENGKMNLNIQQIKGSILSVSQFTLYADTRKGNRPGFDQSADPATAENLWKHFNEKLREGGVEVEEGVFGAHMEVGLLNDGPVTVLLESKSK